MVNDFHYPLLSDDDFDAKPMILLVGAYNAGDLIGKGLPGKLRVIAFTR